ncbi:MAG: universal stress protein [Frankiaceae bacterium]
MVDNLIVVGVDGSNPSKVALDWALQEAVLRNARVRAVGVVDVRMVPSAPLVGAAKGDLVGAASSAVDDAVNQAQRAGGGVTVEGEITTGHPARALIDLSQDAELLVVGRRGHSPLAGLLMGLSRLTGECARGLPGRRHPRTPVATSQAGHFRPLFSGSCSGGGCHEGNWCRS